MNGSTSVDPALAERVREAALSLDYTASPLARGLVLGRTESVAVVVPDLGNPTFQGALRGLSTGAARDGYHVLIADSHEQPSEERELAIQARRRCDGIVLCAPRMPADELAELLPQLAPVVLINRDPSPSPTPAVVADYQTGLTQLLEHLHSLDHRELLYLAGAESAESHRERLVAVQNFESAHSDTRITITPCGVEFADGYDAAEAVIGSGATGVLAFNDLVGMGLLSSLAQRSVRIPRDVSVAGFDDIPFARYTTPPLTTAAVPVQELGEQAWQRIVALLEGRAPAANLMLRPQLVARGSTGPARSA